MKHSFLKGLLLGLGIGGCLALGLLVQSQTGNLEELPPEVKVVEEVKTEESIDERAPMSETTPDNTLSAKEDTASEPEEVTIPEPEPEEDTAEEKDVVLAFAGDVMFSEQSLAAYDRDGILALADQEMLSAMHEADLFLLNEEFPFSLQGEAMEDKQYTFRIDPKYVKIFQDLGTDVVTVANNHALDFGMDAFCDTLDTLKEAGITCIGGGYNIANASAPAVYTIHGQSFAIFGATRVSPSYDWYATDNKPGMFQTYDPVRLNEAIANAKQQYDYTIVFLHWGIERNEIPEDYQRTLAKGYIDAGADLVVGCHPHILQGFEYYNGVPIIYSLGNYLFGNRDGETILLETTFCPGQSADIQLIPCKRINGILTRIQESSNLYQHLTELSFNAKVADDGVLVAQ